MHGFRLLFVVLRVSCGVFSAIQFLFVFFACFFVVFSFLCLFN